MADEEITYQTNPDGTVVRVQTSVSKPKHDDELMNEWNGLLGQQLQLTKDLEACIARINALRPHKEAYEAKVAAAVDAVLQSNEEAAAAIEEGDTTVAVEKVPDEVVSWNKKRKDRIKKDKGKEA